MKPFRDAPIKRKLMLIMLLTSTVALIIASASFMAYDIVTFRERIKNDILAQAEIIARNSTSALSFNDPGVAERTLSTLSVRPHIVSAALYTDKGALFARYSRHETEKPVPERPGPD